MKIYDIRFCKKEEMPLLVNFIKNHWQSDHIFVKSLKMLNFQHYDSALSRYNFIIGFNTITNEIDGIIGTIPLSQFDSELAKNNDTWGGIWKVRTDVKNHKISTLGASLFSIFDSYSSHGSIGMSKIATILHKIRKYKIGVLKQYYILNNRVNDFKVADNVDLNQLPFFEKDKSNIKIKLIEDILAYQETDFKETYVPKKSIRYLYNRFQQHPIYKYNSWEIFDSKSKAIIITRKIQIHGTYILRIVDVYGRLEKFGSLFEQFQEILYNESAEYIDILNFGISDEIFLKIGFTKLDVKGQIIIPNYFEPFQRENIEINCAYRSTNEYVIFKADSDQDRPSIL